MSANNNAAMHHFLSRCFRPGLSRLLLLAGAFVISLTWRMPPASALPEFAVMERARCIQCHVNAQGGGIRNARGWNFMRNTGLVKPENVGLDRLYGLNDKSNSLLGNRLILGFDERVQMAKSHRSEDAERKVFNMQSEAYADFKLTGWLHLNGSYNFAETGFDGQSEWTGSVIFQPEYSYRQVRVGRFRPAIGLRYDDHTMNVGNEPGAFGTVITPPGFTEYGVQYTEENIDWLSFSLGAFDGASLAESFVIDPDGNLRSLIDDEHNLSWLVRASFRSDWGGDAFNIAPGVSYFVNDDFGMLDVFAGAGIGENLSLIADYTRSEKDGMRTTHNLMLEAGYRIIPPVMLILRGERGRTYTEVSGGDELETYTNQGLVGAQIFVLPSVEIRPEYRIVDTERFRSTRWAVQVHIFR